MTEKITKCDRCKKVIDKYTTLQVTFFKPKRYICRFSDRYGYVENNHDLCRDCWEKLIEWFNADVGSSETSKGEDHG